MKAYILDSGIRVDVQVMESVFGKMEVFTKDIGRQINFTVKEN